jgi:predicted nucleic-acid-binding protein
MQTADTNVLARALISDPGALAQSRLAQEWLAAQNAIYVPQAVQLELVWVLDRALGIARSDIVLLLERLSSHAAVSLQNPSAFAAGLDALRNGADFGDCFFVSEALAAGSELVTFDRKLARRVGARLLES